MTGQEIEGVPVITDMDNAANYICQQWVDEVLINVSRCFPISGETSRELLEMGLVVHLNLAKVKSTTGQKQFVERIGSYTVLTTTMNYATDRQAFCQTSHWIFCGGLVGCIFTGIIFVAVGTCNLHQFTRTDLFLPDTYRAER